MIQTVGWTLLQAAILMLLAPFIQGLIKKLKAGLQSRIGPRIFQSYYDIIKSLKKDAVISEQVSWLTKVTPYITFTSVITAGLLVPTFIANAPLSFAGDVIMVVYLLGLARFFTALTALDAGSSFGGMGSSREMALGAIIEPALLLALFTVCLSSGTTKLGQIVQIIAEKQWNLIDPSYGLALLAMLTVVIAEIGRIPVDNPDTHLELTMIHEGMLLEYSGRYLGLMMWAAQIKQLVMLNLFISTFFPWGIAFNWSGKGLTAAIFIYLLKLVALGIVLAFIETAYAKIRLFKVPKLLASSMALSVLAVIMRVVM
ncbi:formate hydrogenlyase [Desulforamulus profundi]|uniref:Formate hydrogenlyase n=2 Tax=Desulforamulus profundi TaxID=1383067 RepID=A0A2C6MIF9_9FIRM|nr:formate hydrogenlyase [Desulforamulus profundi]